MHQNLPTVAKSENVAAANDYPAGTLFLCPVEDLLALGVKLADWLAYTVRIKILRRSPVDPLNPPATFKELARSYKLTYFNDKKKMLNFSSLGFSKTP